MSITVTQRPFPANAATSNIYFVLETDRSLLTPYVPAEYTLTFPAGLPLSGNVTLSFGAIEITLVNSTSAYDPLDPTQVDCDTTIVGEAKRRIANAINNNRALNAQVRAFLNFSGDLKIVSVGGVLPPYTITSDTPGEVAITQDDPGAVATFRRGYRLVNECYIPQIESTIFGSQEVFVSGSALAIPSKLTSDTEAATDEVFSFHLQRILRPFLGYDGFAINTDPQYLSEYAKAFFSRFREEYSAYQGKWLYDPTAPLTNPSDPYDADLIPLEGAIFPEAAHVHLAVNAQAYDADTLIENSYAPGAGLCILTGTDYPDALAEFFTAVPRRFLSTFNGKVSQYNAHELLAFFVWKDDGISLPTLTLRKTITHAGGGITVLDTAIPPVVNTDCFSQITNEYVGRTIQLQPSQLWDGVDCSDQRVCYEILALLPNDNVYIYGDNGTFESGPLQHQPFDFASSGCGSPEVSLASSTSVAFAGTHSMAVTIGCRWSDETFKIRATNDLALQPNTEYEVTAWVYVRPTSIIDGFGFGTQIYLDVQGFSDSTLTVVDTFDYSSDPRGQWVQLRSILDTGTIQTGRIVIDTDSTIVKVDANEVMYFDNIRVQRTSLDLLTQPYAFELYDCCDELVTFAFQNALGVPETMHFKGRVVRGWELESEQAKAQQDYTTLPSERRELFKTQSKQTQIFQLNTVAESFNLFKLHEMLSSGHVDWITTDREETDRCQSTEATERVIPIEFTTDEIDVKRISNGSLQITLEWQPSREQNRIQK